MGNWDTMSKQFNIVIDMPNGKSLDQYDNDITIMLSSLNSSGYIYFAIKHDRDTNTEGDLKRLHYHLVLISSTRKRCSTICYTLADMLGDYPIDTLQIQVIDNLALSVQYLIHKNDATKYQYSFDEIQTNNKESLMSLFACDIASLKVDERLLFHLVDCGYSPLEIMFKIGLGNYSMYKKVITDLYDCKKRLPTQWGKLVLLYGETQHD